MYDRVLISGWTITSQVHWFPQKRIVLSIGQCAMKFLRSVCHFELFVFMARYVFHSLHHVLVNTNTCVKQRRTHIRLHCLPGVGCFVKFHDWLIGYNRLVLTAKLHKCLFHGHELLFTSPNDLCRIIVSLGNKSPLYCFLEESLLKASKTFIYVKRPTNVIISLPPSPSLSLCIHTVVSLFLRVFWRMVWCLWTLRDLTSLTLQRTVCVCV